jgi:hypothetical protein
VFAESRRGGSQAGTKKKRKVKASGEVSAVDDAHSLDDPREPQGNVHVGLNNSSLSTSSLEQPHQPPQPPQPAFVSLDSNVRDIPLSEYRESFENNRQSSTPLTPPIPDQALPPTEQARSLSSTNATSVSNQGPHEETSFPIPPQRSSEFSTMQGALVFLARAAGTMAKADDRDNINARDVHAQLENQESNASSSGNSPVNYHSNSNVNSRQGSTTNNDNGKMFDKNFAPLIRPDGSKPASLPPVDNPASMHPRSTKKLSDIVYIGEGKMLTEKEAIRLINLFFLTLHPFFPHIPQQLHSPNVLAGYPILLCAILTIASRYHTFEDETEEVFNENSRNIQLHERLWIYCQRLISQTVWAEASTRSIGTALAFLLFTEWNPRAIHWRWSDYANNPDFKDGEMDKDDQRAEEDDNLAGLSAMRRSDRMAWMLVGTSVRLSQDMGFITGSPEIFVATHIAETNTAMNLGQRSMLSQSLGEVDLNNEEEDDISGAKKYQYDEFILSLDEETMRRRSLQKKSLKFTFSQKAKLEILKIMSLAYETIYLGGNYPTDGTSSRQTLTVLGVLSPLIENWYRTYKKLLRPSNPKNFNHHCNLKQAGNAKHVNEITRQIDKESLICDYYYCQLYIYALALSMENPLNSNVSDVKKPLNNIRLDEISKASKYVEIAYNSAKEILNAAIRIHKLKLLKYMPVRWVTRIVRSVAFIVKCFLTLTNRSKNSQSKMETSALLSLSIIPIEDILQTIQKAAIVLREASPDELHLCTRYSTILMYLCTEMKHRTKFQSNAPEIRKLDENDDEDEEDGNVNERVAPSMNEQQAQYGYSQSSLNSRPDLQDQSLLDNSNDYIPQRPLFPDSLSSFLPQPQQQFQNYPQQQSQSDNSFNYPNANSTDENKVNIELSYQQMGGRADVTQPLPEAVIDWFFKNDESIGLDFVEPWTEMLEQQLGKKST